MGKKRWKKGLLGTVVALMFMASASMSWATYMADIAYDYADLGGGDYQINFTVSNTSTDPDIANLDFFMIFLDSDDWDLFTNVFSVYLMEEGLLKAFPIRGFPSAFTMTQPAPLVH
jgi:hypothetical protein